MADFGFVGAAYEAPSIYQDAQECINFRPEIDPTKAPGSRGVVALYPTPGLQLELNLGYAAPVRGMRALSGDQWLLVVCGDRVYSITNNYVASQVGTMQTSSGPVCISDNITTASGLVATIVDGANRYIWVASTNSFSMLNDGPWLGATIIDAVDNYNVYNNPGSREWAATDLGSVYSTEGYYGVKDGSPDNLVSLIVDRRQVYLLGDVTTEVWTDTGNVISGVITFPFSRVPGTSIQSGCGAPYSVARFADSFALVCKDTRGNSTIEVMAGYTYKKISTHAVEQTLVNQTVSDAIAYTYQIEGHEIYVVTFPSIGEHGLTWAYDLATQQWHKWLYWDSSKAVFTRHRGNCHAFFNNVNLVGDYENGLIYSLQNAVYTDNGSTIRRIRRAPHLTNDLQRQYFDELQIQFQPGVGLNVGQGQDPQAMLRWSNDGGSTWSSEHWTSIGKIGKYKNRAIWRRLGLARDRIFEVTITDPVNAVIVSANLKASVGEN